MRWESGHIWWETFIGSMIFNFLSSRASDVTSVTLSMTSLWPTLGSFVYCWGDCVDTCFNLNSGKIWSWNVLEFLRITWYFLDWFAVRDTGDGLTRPGLWYPWLAATVDWVLTKRPDGDWRFISSKVGPTYASGFDLLKISRIETWGSDFWDWLLINILNKSGSKSNFVWS